ncbi:DNA starvation/stationary phase protection protein [Streptomyces sp. NHF165]|uniref:DNA starvation/stationary phase protection protein n=1 Tax=Streptomyces cacaoi TaxID=1898 RepID=A0A4Y3R987_STRCI|nr:DNA starvation/stationary phase protection protein [Streptomyces sp. NRRL F-5053]NNG87348.1 DNA starvation/stationary phase protection protein [Streptomyces cacaoi]QHF96823.1 DNA starvation/stationary phase protection protein [Streptomyces sp. NHF165]GEB53378.1 DNA starvation/stationary phase protection protein [Streptomyces cacaoi]
MTSYAVKSTLPEADLKTVADALQGTLMDLIDLSLVAKQIHWNVVGPRFRSIHLQLDEVVTTARDYSDTVAERASALGISPDGRSGTVANGSAIPSVSEGWQPDTDAVRTMVTALEAVVGKARERMKAVGPVDPVTEDVFIQLVGDLEKEHWMFQAENQG